MISIKNTDEIFCILFLFHPKTLKPGVYSHVQHISVWTEHIQVPKSLAGEQPPCWTAQREDLSEGEWGWSAGTTRRGGVMCHQKGRQGQVRGALRVLGRTLEKLLEGCGSESDRMWPAFDTD